MALMPPEFKTAHAEYDFKTMGASLDKKLSAMEQGDNYRGLLTDMATAANNMATFRDHITFNTTQKKSTAAIQHATQGKVTLVGTYDKGLKFMTAQNQPVDIPWSSLGVLDVMAIAHSQFDPGMNRTVVDSFVALYPEAEIRLPHRRPGGQGGPPGQGDGRQGPQQRREPPPRRQ